MIKPIQNLVPASKYNIKCPFTMNAEFISFHNTASDASSRNEIAYMIRNNSQISYHYAIDDIEVVQGLPLNRNGWHCGDGVNGVGNRKSIGVEVCYSRSGGVRYNKSVELAVKFIAQLLHERKWGVDRVKPHQHWSGKYCPHRVFDTEGWNSIINRIQRELTALSQGKIVQVSAPVVSRGYLLNGDKGNAVKALQTKLNQAGYKLVADGHFGQLTENAVKALQKDNKIKVDGVAGQQTMQVLEALLAPKPPVVEIGKRLGEVELNQNMNYRKEPNVKSDVIRVLQKGHNTNGKPYYYYEVKGDWLRLGVGWISNKDGKYAKVKPYPKEKAKPVAAPKPVATPKPTTSKPKEDVYRVLVDGKQTNAYSKTANILEEVEKALKGKANKVEIQKI